MSGIRPHITAPLAVGEEQTLFDVAPEAPQAPTLDQLRQANGQLLQALAQTLGADVLADVRLSMLQTRLDAVTELVLMALPDGADRLLNITYEQHVHTQLRALHAEATRPRLILPS